MQFLTMLAMLYAPIVEWLGHPVFAEREAAQARLCELWPLPLVPVWVGLGHDDPEVRVRCRRIVSEELLADWAAVLLVMHEGKYKELPWGDFDLVTRVVRTTPGIAGGLVRFAKAHGLRNDWEKFDFELCLTFDYPAGLDHIRFRWRRIPTSKRGTWDQESLSVMRGEWQAMNAFRGK